MDPDLAAVLTVNDRGVSLMAVGEFQTASFVFRNALQRMRAVTAIRSGPRGGLHRESNDSVVPFPVRWRLGGTAIPVAYEENDDDELDFVAFRRGITITTAQQDEDIDHYHHLTTTTTTTTTFPHELIVATILYNSALAYDMRRKKNLGTHGQCGFMERAVNLYEQALSLLQSIASTIDEDNRFRLLLLLLLCAAANNRAVLALEMCDYETLEGVCHDLLRPHMNHSEDLCFDDFFASNILATETSPVRARPAPAA